MTAKKYILITRPVEEARVFARKLKQEGLHAMVEPMLEIEHKEFEVPDIEKYQGIVFTSVNAVRGLAAQLGAKGIKAIDYPAYCVGDRTAKEARTQGFEKVFSAKGTADELIEMISKKITSKELPLLYVKGEHTARPVDKILKELGFRLNSIVVYTAKPVKSLSPECLMAIRNGRLEAITFFSKRTVDTFVREIKKNGMLQELFAIKLLLLSDSMLESVRPYRKARTHTAKTPDAVGMLELIWRTCK